MNIMILVHSQTGTTRRFADIMAQKLQAAGHQLSLTPLVPRGKVKPGATSCEIADLPDCTGQDMVLIGGPVWGASATPVVLSAIRGLTGVQGIKVLPFVTMLFPLEILGGRRALGQMSAAAKSAGASVLPGMSIQKLFHDQNVEMQRKADALVKIAAGT